ncbi:GGDEF domain-containing protein [Mycobacterium sp. THU-M104]|uniref:GGDEF domain-containing protein n=1 Tax=Mycobacterium sp. THU-M104 TaxID=3410515 RepID=UPI003B9B32B7
MKWVGRWWRQTDDYEQLISHLRTRGMPHLVRAAISLISAGLALAALATVWTPTGPRGTAQVACVVLACGSAAIVAAVWAVCWPPRDRAVRLALLTNTSIALAVLAQSHPVAALLVCTTFGINACYVAVFHTARQMGYCVAVAAAVGAFEADRIAGRYGLAAAGVSYLLILMLDAAMPFALQTITYMLRTDAVLADRDQLTGLLNRRAFRRRAKVRLQEQRVEFGHFVVAVIDLDRFKLLNDVHGHGTGDDALVSVARALRAGADGTAVIGRVGGEEFLVADAWSPDEVRVRAERLCAAIAALPFGVTASVGTAGVHGRFPDRDNDELLNELISVADAAMYAAKRRGGNLAGRHVPLTLCCGDGPGAEKN